MGNRHHKLYLSQHTWPYHYKFHGRSFVCMCTKFISAAKIIRFYLKSSQLTETVGKTFSLRIQHKLFNFPLNRICVHHDKILGHDCFNILFIVEITFYCFICIKSRILSKQFVLSHILSSSKCNNCFKIWTSFVQIWYF